MEILSIGSRDFIGITNSKFEVQQFNVTNTCYINYGHTFYNDQSSISLPIGYYLNLSTSVLQKQLFNKSTGGIWSDDAKNQAVF